MAKTIAVIFDVFGTLIKIEDRRNPYIHFLKYARKLGLSVRCEHLELLMTRELDWGEAADQLRIPTNYEKLQGFALDLQKELESMVLYQDAQQTLAMLQEAGLKVGLCSNLASGYGQAVRDLLPNMDAYTFSFEIGAVKPDPLIYYTVCCELGVVPEEQLWGDRIFMIGDSIKCDRNGARAAGIAGFHLNRAGKGDFSSLIEFARLIVEEKRVGFLQGRLKVSDDLDEVGQDRILRDFEGSS